MLVRVKLTQHQWCTETQHTPLHLNNHVMSELFSFHITVQKFKCSALGAQFQSQSESLLETTPPTQNLRNTFWNKFFKKIKFTIWKKEKNQLETCYFFNMAWLGLLSTYYHLLFIQTTNLIIYTLSKLLSVTWVSCATCFPVAVYCRW